MTLPPYSLADPSVFVFVLIPLLLVGTLGWGTAIAWRREGQTRDRVRRTALLVMLCASTWMALTWTLASRGTFLDFQSKPPPFGVFVIAVVVLSVALAFSDVGRRLARNLPLPALVGVQAFRLPLELAMHRLSERGIMPAQMTYTGRNFDIVTGATAIVVAALVWRGLAGRSLVLVWNVVGLALLINIVGIAIASSPAFAAFGYERLNVFVLVPPFVWLPAAMVLAAFAGHLIVFRAIAQRR